MKIQAASEINACSASHTLMYAEGKGYTRESMIFEIIGIELTKEANDLKMPEAYAIRLGARVSNQHFQPAVKQNKKWGESWDLSVQNK